MTKFVMYMGLPGSGKTFIAHQHEKEYVIIDSDEVRARILGDATDQSQNAKVFDHMFKETCECLARGVSVAYVATNLSMKRRMNLLASLKKKYPDTIYACALVMAPIDVCHERNSARERSIPTYVIDRMARQFDPPCINEGWTYLETIYNYDRNSFPSYCKKYQSIVKNYGSQENSHHTLTLWEHCYNCGTFARNADLSNDIIQAAFLHDYGKAFTATRWEKDNYKEIHYPNHAEIGSYLALTMGYGLHIAQLIRFHMVPYMDETAKKVWRARLGEQLWEEIIELHYCDEAAH